MTDNTKQENPPGNDRPDIDKLLGGIDEFEKGIELALDEKSEDLEEKLESVRNQMDEATSTIQEFMLGDVHKTVDNLKDSYAESVKELTACTKQAKQSCEAFKQELKGLHEEYQKLNVCLQQKPETQQTINSCVDRIRAWWYLLVQDKIKREKARMKLRECRKRIIRCKASLEAKEAIFKAAKQVAGYNLSETRNINAFLEQSEVYIKWGAVLVAVIYMSVYLSKLFASHLHGLEAFFVITGSEVAVLIVAWLCFFREHTPKKIFVPIAVLLAIPVIHSIYILQAAGDFLRTSGLASAGNIDPSFFFFLLVLLLIYSLRARFLRKFDAGIVIAGIGENAGLKKLIDNRFRLLLWRLWSCATLALVVVSTASAAPTALSSTNEQRVEIGNKKYTLVMQLKERLVLVDSDCSQAGNKSREKCKFFSVLSADIPCLGPAGACPTGPVQKGLVREMIIDKVAVKELTVDKATVMDGLNVGSIRADSGQVENLTVRLATDVEIDVPRDGRRYGTAAYEKLMACLDETKKGDSGAFRVDFLFCKNTSDNPVLSLIAQNSVTEHRILEDIDNLNAFLPQPKPKQAGEYHYIGTASDPGSWENNFSLGMKRLEFVRNQVEPQAGAPVHKWPFGPLPLIELEQLLPKEKMDKLKEKIIGKCPIENSKESETFEQVIQQFAQVAYCPLVDS